MAVILDILGSFIIRAAIVIVILNLMINLHQELSKNTDRITLNESINGASQVIAADIKLAGYNASKVFLTAQSNDISFYADTGNTGMVRNIRYFTGVQPSSATHKILYRTVDGSYPFYVAWDVITFNIVYYNVNGTPVAYGSTVSGIKSIYITLIMESNITEKTYQGSIGDTLALKVKWERHFFPENL